jgi:hypothetical protein
MREFAPAPLARVSGTTPEVNAGELRDQMAFLAASPLSMIKPTWT